MYIYLSIFSHVTGIESHDYVFIFDLQNMGSIFTCGELIKVISGM